MFFEGSPKFYINGDKRKDNCFLKQIIIKILDEDWNNNISTSS